MQNPYNRKCDKCGKVIPEYENRAKLNNETVCMNCYNILKIIPNKPGIDPDELRKMVNNPGYVQLNDGRHDVSDQMINNLQELAYSQDDFGMNKYKKPLKAHYNYDWLKMAKEELVDLAKYLECETERKNVVLQLLEIAIEDRSWDYVKFAFNELKKDGTAK